jgi:eukaryotic-like serine/threonine-protein kinase
MSNWDPQVKELFLKALKLSSPEERAAFLTQACAGKDALRAQVDSLLEAHQRAGTFLEDPATASMPDQSVESPSTLPSIEGYTLIKKIAEGGQGAVFQALQHSPRRKVAIKVLLAGPYASKSAKHRFEREIELVATLRHPHIVAVFDSGTTADGHLYYAMDYIHGTPMTDYVRTNKLPLEKILELFAVACEAVNHAHQKGVMHRDLKPANMLVDDEGHLHILDFGLAKQMAQPAQTMMSMTGQIMGTLPYMSPEQTKGNPDLLDIRTDVYALGVVLYELLTGAYPYPVVGAMADVLNQIANTAPKPLTRSWTQSVGVSTSTRHRAWSGGKCPIDGEVETIALKALSKERERRYQSAGELGRDIQHYLHDEPVEARRDSGLYLLKRTLSKYRVAASVAALFFVVLITATVLLGVLGREAARQRDIAQKALHEASVARDSARQRAYASDMNVAMQALREGNLGRTLDLLGHQRPQPGESDMRGWEWRYLWGQTRSDALSILCEKTEIESLAVSADGRWLAIGVVHNDGLFVWNLQTRQEVAHLAAGKGYVRAAFSPTEPVLAFSAADSAGGDNSRLTIWNAATRQSVGEFPLNGACAGLAFSQDGRTLVTSTMGTPKGQITLWRVRDGSPLTGYPSEQFVGMNDTNFAVTGDLSIAAYGLGKNQIRLIDLRNGRELWTAASSQAASALEDDVKALAFSPDGKTLAVAGGSRDPDIHLWDVATGKEIGPPLKGHTAWVGSLVFWPDGKKLASASADQTIRTWDVASRTCTDVLRGHRSEVWRLSLLPDNRTLVSRTLVSGCKDGTVCLWDTSIAHPRWERVSLSDGIRTWCFAPDSRSVLTLNSEGQLVRWSGPDLQVKQPLLETGAKEMPSCFSSDGRLLACGSDDGNVSVWDVSRRARVFAFKPATGSVWPLHFLADGNRLVIYSQGDNRLIEWDLAARHENQHWSAPAAFQSAGFAPGEQQWVSLGFEGESQLRNPAQKRSRDPHLDILEPNDMAFAPSGKWLAASSYLGYARVWDTRSWQEVVTLRGFLLAACGVAFSPDRDRQRLAIGGAAPSDALKLWTVDGTEDGWQDVLTLHAEGFLFGQVVFSPDGNAVGVVSNGVLHIWQAPSWDEIAAAEAKQKADGNRPAF